MTALFGWVMWGAVTAGLFYVIFIQIKKMNSTYRPSITNAKPLRTTTKPSGLQSDVLKEGDGPAAKNLDTLTVHYRAFLSTGEEVDSSYQRGRPLVFRLGTGAVILGWDESLKGMKVGEKRKVTVPAKLAYGNKGQNKVPPNATIIFEIDLLGLN